MVKEKLKEIIAKGEFSQNKVSAELGISSAALSQYLKGKYTGDNEKIEQALIGFLNRQSEQKTNSSILSALSYPIGICETRATNAINELARIAYQEGEICVVCGEAGSGKTSGIKAYLHQNGGTVVITASVFYTAKVLYKELAEKFDVSDKGTIYDISKRISRKLKGIKKTIIIDEAEHLPFKALDGLRTLYDDCGFGLVLVGTPRLIYNLKGNQSQYSQLYSRVANYYKIPKMSKQDLKVITNLGLSEKIAERCALETDGNFRQSVKYAKNIKRIAKLNNADIDNESVIQTAKSALVI